MIQQQLTVELEAGLQARQAASFVQEANSFMSDIFIEKADDFAVGYRKFAKDLRKNGDLCQNVMTFIRKKYIIE